MKERPILFSTPMVKAILEGRKTQTRRIVKGEALNWLAPDMFNSDFVASPENNLCPYGNVGDILWVRETFSILPGTDEVYYKANGDVHAHKWKPSIHMPKHACRIKLEITSERVERLQIISEPDSIAEGIEKLFPDEPYCYKSYAVKETLHGVAPIISYRTLWQKINGENSWNENPFVWVIEFKKK